MCGQVLSIGTMIYEHNTLLIDKKNEVFMTVQAEPGLARELSDFFTFFVPGYRFMPSYRNKIWDGKIRLYNLSNNHLYSGLINYVEKFVQDRKYKIDYKTSPKNVNGYNQNDYERLVKSLNLELEPRDYQRDAFLHSINYERSLLLSPTASGKSLIIYLILRHYQMRLSNFKAIVIVPTTSLVVQMNSDFAEYAKKDRWNANDNIHMIYAGYDKVSDKPILVSTWQSLYKMPLGYFSDFDVVIGDEAHQFKARSLTAIMEKTINTRYRFGTTGTLDGTQTHRLALEGLFGPVYKVTTTKKLIDNNTLSRFEIKALVLQYPEKICKALKTANYQEEIEFLVSNKKRNYFIRNLALSLNNNTLILFQLVKKHGTILYDLIKKKTDVCNRTTFFVFGGTDTNTREEIRGIVEHESNAIIIASYGTYSTGINITNLHNVIFASPSKSRIRNLQSIGRGLRKNDAKEIATLYDIADDLSYKSHKNYTLNHFIERIKIYNEEQFQYKILTIPIRE
jgi:superfamily II DNA or RNA helicase